MAVPSQASFLRPQRCQFCGVTYQPRRCDSLYCSTKCSKDGTNLEMKRGRMIYAYAYNWRRRRNTQEQRRKAKEDFAAMCREIDLWAEEDKKLGRPVPEGYVAWKGE